MYRINTLEIEIFLEVAKELSFLKAAEHLYLAQPTVTKWVKHLEKELDIPLFTRNSKQVQLTLGGEALYQSLQPAYEALNAAVLNARIAGRRCKKQLKIGALYGFEFELLSDTVINDFELAYPMVDVDFCIYDFQKLRGKMEELDFILTTNFEMENFPEYNEIRLEPIPLYLTVSKQHPISDRKSVSLADIKNERFLIFSPESSPTGLTHIREAFSARGFSPTLVPVDNIPSQLTTMSRNKGVAITNKNAVKGFEDKVRLVELEDFTLNLHKVMCYRKGKEDSAMMDFVRFMIEAYRY
jgi:DNA-binding transcriptional LysR family regulator